MFAFVEREGRCAKVQGGRCGQCGRVDCDHNLDICVSMEGFVASSNWRSSSKLRRLPAIRSVCGLRPSFGQRVEVVRCRLEKDNFGQGQNEGEDDDVQELEGMSIRWKDNSKSVFPDGRDLLPFDVNILTPPPRELGRFRLDPRLNCGDVVDYDGISYVVRRVRLHYAYKNGRYIVTRKTAEVKTLGRKSLESYLEKLYKEA